MCPFWLANTVLRVCTQKQGAREKKQALSGRGCQLHFLSPLFPGNAGLRRCVCPISVPPLLIKIYSSQVVISLRAELGYENIPLADISARHLT